MLKIILKKINWILTLFFCLQVFSLLIWLIKDDSYLINDAAHHYFFSLRTYEFFFQEGIFSLKELFLDLAGQHRWHGILPGMITSFFYLFFSPSQDLAVFCNSVISLLFLMIGIHSIGCRLFNRTVGVISSMLVFVYPVFFVHARTYMYDLPLTTAVCITLALLLRIERKADIAGIIGLMLSFTCGMLIKINFLAFVFIPSVYTFFKVIKRRQLSSVFLFGMFCIFLILIFPFYSLKGDAVIARLYDVSFFNPVLFYNDYCVVKDRGIWFYLWLWYEPFAQFFVWFVKDTFWRAVSIWGALLAVFGFFSFKWNKERTVFLFGWGAFPLLLLGCIFFRPRIIRYVMPLIPISALLSASLFDSVLKKRSRLIMIIIFLLANTISFALAYGVEPGFIRYDIPGFRSNTSPEIPDANSGKAARSILNAISSLDNVRDDLGWYGNDIAVFRDSSSFLADVLPCLSMGSDGAPYNEDLSFVYQQGDYENHFRFNEIEEVFIYKSCPPEYFIDCNQVGVSDEESVFSAFFESIKDKYYFLGSHKLSEDEFCNLWVSQTDLTKKTSELSSVEFDNGALRVADTIGYYGNVGSFCGFYKGKNELITFAEMDWNVSCSDFFINAEATYESLAETDIIRYEAKTIASKGHDQWKVNVSINDSFSEKIDGKVFVVYGLPRLWLPGTNISNVFSRHTKVCSEIQRFDDDVAEFYFKEDLYKELNLKLDFKRSGSVSVFYTRMNWYFVFELNKTRTNMELILDISAGNGGGA